MSRKDAIGALWWILRQSMLIWTNNDMDNRANLRQGFLDHYAHVRAVVPKEKLLEFRPQDGWAPLCEFIGYPTPTEPFPHVNDTDSLLKLMRYVWVVAVITAAKRVLAPLAAVGAVIVGVWWVRGRAV